MKKIKKREIVIVTILLISIGSLNIGLNKNNIINKNKYNFNNIKIDELLFVDKGRNNPKYVPSFMSSTLVVLSGNCGNLEENEGKNITYSLTENQDIQDTYTLTINGTGKMIDYEVRKTPWNEYRTKITKIEISEGITYLSNNAFLETAITNQIIPESVTALGDNTFWNCNTIEVTLPKKISKLGVTSFYGIFRVSVPSDSEYFSGDESNQIIYNKEKTKVFQASKDIEKYDVPSTVVEIGEHAYNGCSKITGELDLSKNIKIIHNSAFESTGISSVKFSDNITKIGTSAFRNCKELKGTIILPNSLTELSENIFFGSTNIEEIYFGDGIIEIKQNSFINTTNLKKVHFGNNIKKIGAYAFANSGIEGTLKLPDSIETIEDAAFNKCQSITELILPKNLKSVGKYAFSDNGITGSLHLPEQLEEIGIGAFSNNKNLNEVYIPKNVKTIKYSAFSYLTSLNKIAISYGERTYTNSGSYPEYVYTMSPNIKTIIYADKSLNTEGNIIGLGTLFSSSINNIEYLVLGKYALANSNVGYNSNFKGGLYTPVEGVIYNEIFLAKVTKYETTTKKELTLNDSLQIATYDKPENGEDVLSKVTYKSSDEAVAEVDSNGKVTGKSISEKPVIISILYEGTVFEEVELQIVPIEINVTMINKEAAYNGKQQGIKIEEELNETDVAYSYKLKDTEDLYTEGYPIDSGIYIIKSESKNKNYKLIGTTTAELTIKKANQEILYTKNNIYKNTKDNNFTNEILKIVANGSITYSSSNKEIAKVSSSGEITINKSGNVKITATISETNNYNKYSASYNLVIYESTMKVVPTTEIKNIIITKDIDAVSQKKLENNIVSKYSDYFKNAKILYTDISLIDTSTNQEIHDEKIEFILEYPTGINSSNYREYEFYILHKDYLDNFNIISPEMLKEGLKINSTPSSFAIGYKLKNIKEDTNPSSNNPNTNDKVFITWTLLFISLSTFVYLDYKIKHEKELL